MLSFVQEVAFERTLDCSPWIDHNDIAGVLRNYYDLLADPKTRRLLLQQTQTLLTLETRRWVWKDAQITVHGPRMEVVFFSGDRTNKYVVHLDGDDRPINSVVEKGWRLWLTDGVWAVVTAPWRLLKGLAGAIRGSDKKAIENE
ncbi:uncharacterized protein LOC118416347 [Branchiostoma floridae]|uniref:Uncharacterized protein LOC118416347 n=1 Tax=Branchiostoma floridae TaxID=7739 RepID=A0A9J7L717_BRAFL|nr:uncharacterized protein LOC118416347 [Branchiostoma floridae]